MDFSSILALAVASIGAAGAALTAVFVLKQNRWNEGRTSPVVRGWAVSSRENPLIGDLWVGVTNRQNASIILHETSVLRPPGIVIRSRSGFRQAASVDVERGLLVHPGDRDRAQFVLNAAGGRWPKSIEISVEIELPTGKRRRYRVKVLMGSLPPIDPQADDLWGV